MSRWRSSLRLRLLLGAALWVAVALAGAGWALQGVLRAHVEGQIIARMAAGLDRMAGELAVAANGTVSLPRPPPDPDFMRPLSGLYWQVESDQGRVLLRSRSLWDGVIRQAGIAQPADDAPGALHAHPAIGPGGEPLLVVERLVVFPDYDRPFRLVMGHATASIEALMGGFRRTLAVSLGILAVGLIGAAWAQVAFGLIPLVRLRRALGAIRAGRTERLEDTYPVEVQPLVDDLNALLAHNARMVDNARDSAGNLAHALKTPLAIVGNEAQALMARGEGDVGALLSQQVLAMRRQIDHHLARARAQAAGEARGAGSAVGESLVRLARTLGRLHPVTPVLDITPGLPAFRGDRQTLEEILGNLMDNACKWAHATVTVSAGPAGPGRLRVVVADDGPGIPADRLGEVLRRGRRLDESKPGSGLGLAIVEDLTRAAGGTLTLDAAPGLGGLRATVELPAATESGEPSTAARGSV